MSASSGTGGTGEGSDDPGLFATYASWLAAPAWPRRVGTLAAACLLLGVVDMLVRFGSVHWGTLLWGLFFAVPSVLTWTLLYVPFRVDSGRPLASAAVASGLYLLGMPLVAWWVDGNPLAFFVSGKSLLAGLQWPGVWFWEGFCGGGGALCLD